MKLTIGMAHFDDYDGVWSTLHALRRYHDLRDVELLVVDNSPASPHGASVKDLCAKIGAKYVALPDAVGTSIPRDRVFAEASGDVVVCMDCHVLIDAGGVTAIRDWYAAHKDSRDMLCGPLLNDSGGLLGTQFNDVWRAEMWGVWGSAWECNCERLGLRCIQDEEVDPLRFTPLEQPDNGLRYAALVDQMPAVECQRCGGPLPVLGWASHEAALVKHGYTWLGADPRSKPFEVLGQGLGLFAMRRDSWVGFNPHAQGFGGEELYVHAKVRAAGGRVLCHPAVRWTHRFGRPNGVPYTIGRYSKVRNYVLEFQEMGWNLDPIREHFVDTKLLSEREWKHLLVDPVNHVTPPGGGGCGTQRAVEPESPFRQIVPGPQNLDTLFEWCKVRPRDLEKHADKIRELASHALHVTAIVKRREWDVFLLAGRPDDLVTYTTEHDALHAQLHKTVLATETNPRAPRRIKHYTVHAGADSTTIDTIEPTDLLVIDTVHHADRLLQELSKFAPQVRQRICLRGTQAFGEIAEGGGGPGLLAGLRRWMREHPEWSVIYHSPEQYGLTVISRDPADKPDMPGVLTLASNFAKAVAAHVGDGLQKVEPEQLEARLLVCSLCDQRRDNRCSVCGCFLEPKAGMRSSSCPLGRWPELPAVVISSASEAA